MPVHSSCVTRSDVNFDHTELTSGEQAWFAIYTVPRHEKRIAQHLEQRQIESFLPLYSAQRRWKNRSKIVIDLPLFPNYLFVRLACGQRVRVLEVPGVVSLVGTRREACALPEDIIESLRTGLRQRRAEPHPYLVVGERARIKAGALAGMEGVLLRKKNNFRIVLTLDQIMQSIAIEVDAADLEPLHSSRATQQYAH